MTGSKITKLKKLAKQNRTVRLLTRHIDGDKYDGVILSCKSNLVIIQNENDFEFDGIDVFPLKHIKGLRLGSLERQWDRIISQNKQIKKINRFHWVAKIDTLQEMIQECQRRKIWPIVETQSHGSAALHIGPITQSDNKCFHMFCYDATGKWEKNYQLFYKEIVRIEMFDKYSKHFNRYMMKKLPDRFRSMFKK